MALRYDVLNEKRKHTACRCFARGFLPNGGHPLVLFRWTFRYDCDCWTLSRMPPLSLQLSIQSGNSGSAVKNRKPPSTTRFFETKPHVAEVQNRGLVGSSSIFPALPELPYGSMRQIPERPSTPPFSRKETAGRSVAAFRCGRQFDNLPHTSGLSSIRDGLRHFCVRPADCFRS